jgi:hypothetical protein
MALAYLSALERECLNCMRANTDLQTVEAFRLEDDLLITAQQLSDKRYVALFVVAEIEDLDVTFKWCAEELADHQRRQRVSGGEWLMGVAYPTSVDPNYAIEWDYRRQARWTLAPHPIPQEAIARLSKTPPMLPDGVNHAALTLPQVLDLMIQGRGDKPNAALDEAIEKMQSMIEKMRVLSPQRALPA